MAFWTLGTLQPTSHLPVLRPVLAPPQIAPAAAPVAPRQTDPISGIAIEPTPGVQQPGIGGYQGMPGYSTRRGTPVNPGSLLPVPLIAQPGATGSPWWKRLARFAFP